MWRSVRPLYNFHFVSYRLVSISFGFASEASSVSYFTLYLDESCFSFTNWRDFRKMIENQRPNQPKVNIPPCSSTIISLRFTFRFYVIAGAILLLCGNVKRTVTAKQNICAILYRCFPAVQSSSPYGICCPCYMRTRVRRCNICCGLNALIIVADNAPIKINRISTVSNEKRVMQV